MNASGRLTCVGLGIIARAHLTSAAKSHIESSDVVFVDVPHASFVSWLKELHGDVRTLGHLRSEPKPRIDIDKRIVDILLTEVRSGKTVCAAFYGHPGVFGAPAQLAIQQARLEGYSAHLEPGISVADCLYADLGIDPGKYGCQHYEASQLIQYRRSLDSSAYLLVWNLDAAADGEIPEANAVAYRKVLLEALAGEYPPEHGILVYRPADPSLRTARILRLPLALLPSADIGPNTCVVIPPAAELLPDPARQARVAALASS